MRHLGDDFLGFQSTSPRPEYLRKQSTSSPSIVSKLGSQAPNYNKRRSDKTAPTQETNALEMAMDALNDLDNNLPNWLKSLDDLSGQINQRQAELAAMDVTDKHSHMRSLQNKSSQESLKPADDDPSFIHAPDGTLNAALSAEARTTVYRTRSMNTVYYDSYIQGFFDELVRFISSHRNRLRKAKMAARVGQIKNRAEIGTSAMGEDGEESNPFLQYITSWQTGPVGAMSYSGFNEPQGPKDQPDIYDNLDKGLEAVQRDCERSAHQLLRGANCSENIMKIQNELREVMLTGAKEVRRMKDKKLELPQDTSSRTRPGRFTPRACEVGEGLSPSAKGTENPAPAAMNRTGRMS